eukprot:6204374-Pleurochrysis_carterae.AAC.2
MPHTDIRSPEGSKRVVDQGRETQPETGARSPTSFDVGKNAHGPRSRAPWGVCTIRRYVDCLSLLTVLAGSKYLMGRINTHYKPHSIYHILNACVLSLGVAALGITCASEAHFSDMGY